MNEAHLAAVCVSVLYSLIILCLCREGGVLIFITAIRHCRGGGLNGFLPLQFQWLPRVGDGSPARGMVSIQCPHPLCHMGEVV